MFPDVGPLEVITIAVIGILLFGPDKLPEVLQNAARTVRRIREFSGSAQQEIRSELGPELQDFDVRDLHPKTFVRKHVLSGDDGFGHALSEIRDALDPRPALSDVADTLRDAASGNGPRSGGAATLAISLAKPPAVAERTRTGFDPDAT
ncbi:Sec-independent protein translocase subunit TatB [Streptomyces sp. P01-B04]|uniref:sec-independent translocase n=1 Tax=Streptomyces poriferorum TaxID=2798799 RepID=UPI001C5DD0A9|nr:sec-independent translocase [Streptomyces poriferorum]MBW5252115.1 Sec-independent protein translocase subunit TatB [Streptomyces poriferorum]MBW5260277.1 Sec-independent protein translocase subunit TatB [Streptomyces poriferorum]